jgi:hypothetical protein
MDPDDHCASSRERMNRSSYFLPFEGTPASLAPGPRTVSRGQTEMRWSLRHHAPSKPCPRYSPKRRN